MSRTDREKRPIQEVDDFDATLQGADDILLSALENVNKLLDDSLAAEIDGFLTKDSKSHKMVEKKSDITSHKPNSTGLTEAKPD